MEGNDCQSSASSHPDACSGEGNSRTSTPIPATEEEISPGATCDPTENVYDLIQREKLLSLPKIVLYVCLILLSNIFLDVLGYWIGIPILLYFGSFLSVPVIVRWKIGRMFAKDSSSEGLNLPLIQLQIRSMFVIYFVLIMIIILPIWAVFYADSRHPEFGRKWQALLEFLGAPEIVIHAASYPIRSVFLVYVVWCWTWDTKASKTGRRFWPALRYRRFWRHFAAYFPISLRRDGPELDPNKNYLFGYHPHGIISVGALCNFGTCATGFHKLFPGIDIRLLTLESNFRIPLFREYLLGLGINDASRESCINNLTRAPNASIMLVVGGAAESLYATPGNNDLVLATRKGFVKIALTTGASLVPVFSFGETDVFAVWQNDKFGRIQKRMQKALGFAMPLFYGRALSSGMLFRAFGSVAGILPLRMPVVSVVGRPIACPKIQNPTHEDVDMYHAKYCEELQRIHDKYRKEYCTHREEIVSRVYPEKEKANLFRMGSLHELKIT